MRRRTGNKAVAAAVSEEEEADADACSEERCDGVVVMEQSQRPLPLQIARNGLLLIGCSWLETGCGLPVGHVAARECDNRVPTRQTVMVDG